MTKPVSEKPRRLPLLDGLRGMAAIAVVFHHEPGMYGSHGLLPRAYLAVDFFFMLSGFVLTLAYERRLQSGLRAALFMWQRVARLWPVLAVGVGIGAIGAVIAGTGAISLAHLALGLVLLPWVRPGHRLYELNGPQWSLTFELLANAAHALVLQRLGNRALGGVALVCGAVLVWQGRHWGSLASGDMAHNWWGGFARVGFSYVVGVLIGRCWQLGRGKREVRWWLAALPLPLILLTAPLWPLSAAWGDSLAVLVLMPPALWLAAQTELPDRVALWFDRLGQISYPIYAIHGPLLLLAADQARHLPAPAQFAARTAALALTFALAWGLAISPLAKAPRRSS